jgi:hypothetical protein
MDSTPTSLIPDKSMRCVGLAGVLVGAVALIGVDLVSADRVGHRHTRVPAAIHFVSSTDAAIAAIAVGTVGAVTLALALLLWLGRRTADEGVPLPLPASQSPHIDDSVQASRRNKLSISYRSGGLYGP